MKINQQGKNIFANKFILILLSVILTSAISFAAVWVPLIEKPNWDYSESGDCLQADYCFVTKEGDENKNRAIDYFKAGNKKTEPRCIINNDYIKDFYCENGDWSTRTKILALELSNIAAAESPSEYTLFCGPIDVISIKTDSHFTGTFKKEQKNIPRVNSACTLKYSKGTALALSVNSDIDSKLHSPLLSLGVKEDYCNNAKNSLSFEKCTQGTLQDHDIYYNNKIQGLIYLPKSSSIQSFNVQQMFNDLIKNPLKLISDYVKAVIHNPNRADLNFDFFDKTKLFSNVYITKSGGVGIFAFLEKTTPQNYIGIKYSGVNLNSKSCEEIFKISTEDFHCLNQPSPNEFMLAAKTPAAVKHWTNLTSSLRIT